MDLNELYEEMDEEEQDAFMNCTATGYFHFIEKREPFQNALGKLEGGIPLEDEDWDYVTTKLFLVGCKIEREDEKVDLLSWLCELVSKIGMKVFKKDRPLYIECLKMVEEVWAIRKNTELKLEFFEGMQNVLDSIEESDLDILLRQCREDCIFRDNQDAYEDDYIHNSSWGYMSTKARMYIHACHQSYERSHAIFQEYPKK